MKISKVLMVSFFIVSIITSIIFVSYSSDRHNKISTDELSKHLRDITKIRISHVLTFLEGKRERAIDFSSDGLIKNILRKLEKSPSEQLMNELSEHLINNKIVVDESFYEIAVLNKEGKVVGTTNPEENFLDDLSQNLIFIEGKKEPYIKESFYDEEFKRDGIAFSAPILDAGEFMGVIIVKTTMDQFRDIIISAGEFSEYEQLYVLDKNSFMITPSKFLEGENKGILTQKVDTESSRNCLELISTGEFEKEASVFYFLDYRGEEVIGASNPIPSTSWCLLVEIDSEGGLKMQQREFLNDHIIVGLFIVLVLTLTGFFIGRFFDKRFLLNKKRGRNGIKN